jgi:flavin reductase (DIM6/NTAB) family NADH-FMN oxidoreductase RutF
MEKIAIPVNELALQPFTTFDPNGVLLLVGDADRANVMTISWGSFGIMWGKPVMMVMVRPTRYTWEFISGQTDFTVNWMHAEWADAVRICGSKSGRDMDKFEATGLTAAPAARTIAPVIAQSELTLECRTLCHSDLNPEQFLDPGLLPLYPQEDYHGLFFGEILVATGVERYRVR